MNRITSIDRSERRRLEKIVQRSKDKRFSRRANAVVLVHKAKTITLIVNNYIIHKSRKTALWLKQNPKFRLLFQPIYSPWVNKIEKLWHALHERITRNHRCKEMWELLGKVRRFMDTVSPFPGSPHGLAKVEHN